MKKASTPTRNAPELSGRLYTRRFWLVLSLLLIFAAVVKLPTLRFPHTEADEQVYVSLATRMLTSGSYNLEGTEVLKQLSPGIYDHPLFFHPPLFPLTLVPFVYWNVENLAVLISWFGHALCITSVALIGRRMRFVSNPEAERNSITAWLPVIGICLDPLLISVSRKLWIDSLLSGLCAISLALFFCARYSRRRSFLLVLGGVVFGLAGLSKVMALILMPVAIFLIVTPTAPTRSKIIELALGLGPTILLMLPWFVIFHHTFGVFFPTWIKPDEWLLQHYPFVRLTLERTPLYYFLKLAVTAPVCLLCFGVYASTRRLWTNRMFLLGPLWFLICFLAFSYLGLMGTGFQMRYIAPLIPSIYLMLYAVLDRFRREESLIPITILVLVIYAGMTGAIYLFSPQLDELGSIFELLGWLRL